MSEIVTRKHYVLLHGGKQKKSNQIEPIFAIFLIPICLIGVFFNT